MIKIFRADPDYSHFQNLQTLFFEYYQYLHHCSVPMTLADGGEKIWLEGLRKSLGKTSVLVVCENKKILSGFGQGILKLSPDYLGGKKIGMVSHFYLDEKARGGDSARKMFEEMKSWFVEKGVQSIELQVINENSIGARFWEKMGFKAELKQMRIVF